MHLTSIFSFHLLNFISSSSFFLQLFSLYFRFDYPSRHGELLLQHYSSRFMLLIHSLSYGSCSMLLFGCWSYVIIVIGYVISWTRGQITLTESFMLMIMGKRLSRRLCRSSSISSIGWRRISGSSSFPRRWCTSKFLKLRREYGNE